MITMDDLYSWDKDLSPDTEKILAELRRISNLFEDYNPKKKKKKRKKTGP
jgi:succinate dehydrogenase/fumarate reductase-like Fe-S protein